MNEKYVSVKDLNAIECQTSHHNDISVDWHDIQKLINKAKTMVAVEKIKELIIKHKDKSLGLLYVENLEQLIKPQSEKFGGLTIEQWEQLGKHPFVSVKLRMDMGVRTYYFLSEMIQEGIEFSEITELSLDLPNMTRTDLDLPDGIEIEVTNNNGSKAVITTPFKSTLQTIIKHYRILGVAEDE